MTNIQKVDSLFYYFLSFKFPLIIKITTLNFLHLDLKHQTRKGNRKKMKSLKNLHLLHVLLLALCLFFPTSVTKQTPTSYCGKIRIQDSLFPKNSTNPSLLNQMVLCKSQKLYFRTSLGLFPISSIDYKSKQLTISHTSCSSSLHFVSPSLLSAGFPRPKSNSLLLFNCSNNRDHLLPLISNCTHLHGCKAYSDLGNQELEGFSSCLLVDDLEKMEKGFDPKDLNCSHYSRVYRRSTLVDGDFEGFELGTRISFDIPDHVPNICDECQKPNGNCGVGLRCVCHPKECKDKVVSIAVTMNPFGNILFSLLPFTVAVVLFKGY